MSRGCCAWAHDSQQDGNGDNNKKVRLCAYSASPSVGWSLRPYRRSFT